MRLGPVGGRKMKKMKGGSCAALRQELAVRTPKSVLVAQAAENAERRELIPVRKKSFGLGFLRKRPLAALSDPARPRV